MALGAPHAGAMADDNAHGKEPVLHDDGDEVGSKERSSSAHGRLTGRWSQALAGEVMEALLKLFTAFYNADSKAFSEVVDSNCRFVRTAYTPDGEPDIVAFPYKYFLDTLKTAKKGTFDEKFDDPMVQVRDNMAHVWCRYTFTLNGELKHKGVKSIQLRRAKHADWRIVNVVDTVDTEEAMADAVVEGQ